MNKENINDMPFADTPAKTEEEQINPGHKKTRKKLRKAGIICIIASLPLMCIPFIGFPLLFAGLVMTMMGYAGKLARYQAAEIAPVQKDTFNYLADGTQGGVKTVASAAGEGLASGFAAGGMNPDTAENTTGVRCHKCNFIETPEAKFCSECGAAMEKSKACSKCNELNDPDAKFCDNCGGTF
ncbi:MAG: zinc ribbon domain-containing protein [Planctomycetota bacterium]|jgi:RNA polymerase subunit RPABC4/transcription elongation factor Spt4